MNCLVVLTAVTSSGAALTQPIFQPVNENVLPAELIVTVRSRIPGNEAIGTCSPLNTRRSEEHTSELQSLRHLVCRLLLEKKKNNTLQTNNTYPSLVPVLRHDRGGPL